MKKFNVNKAPTQEGQDIIDAAVSTATDVERVDMEKMRQAQSRSGLRRESQADQQDSKRSLPAPPQEYPAESVFNYTKQVITEKDHQQPITSLQPPPSQMLTLKKGVGLDENGSKIEAEQYGS